MNAPNNTPVSGDVNVDVASLTPSQQEIAGAIDNLRALPPEAKKMIAVGQAEILAWDVAGLAPDGGPITASAETGYVVVDAPRGREHLLLLTNGHPASCAVIAEADVTEADTIIDGEVEGVRKVRWSPAAEGEAPATSIAKTKTEAKTKTKTKTKDKKAEKAKTEKTKTKKKTTKTPPSTPTTDDDVIVEVEPIDGLEITLEDNDDDDWITWRRGQWSFTQSVPTRTGEESHPLIMQAAAKLRLLGAEVEEIPGRLLEVDFVNDRPGGWEEQEGEIERVAAQLRGRDGILAAAAGLVVSNATDHITAAVMLAQIWDIEVGDDGWVQRHHKRYSSGLQVGRVKLRADWIAEIAAMERGPDIKPGAGIPMAGDVAGASPIDLLEPFYPHGTRLVMVPHGKSGGSSQAICVDLHNPDPDHAQEAAAWPLFVPQPVGPAGPRNKFGDPWSDDMRQQGLSMACAATVAGSDRCLAVGEMDRCPIGLTEGAEDSRPSVATQQAAADWVSSQIGLQPAYICTSGRPDGASLHVAWPVMGWSEEAVAALYSVLMGCGYDRAILSEARQMRLPGGTRWDKTGKIGTQTVLQWNPEPPTEAEATAAQARVIAMAMELAGADASEGEGDRQDRRDRLPHFPFNPASIAEAGPVLGRILADSGRVFRRLDGAVMEDVDGTLVARDAEKWAANIERFVWSYAVTKGGGGGDDRERYAKSISACKMKALMANSGFQEAIPLVRAIVPAPVPLPGPDGRWALTVPGYDSRSGVWTNQSDIAITDMSVDEARAVWDDLVVDIPYKSEGDRARHLSMAVQMMMRPGLSIDGPVTLAAFLFDADRPRLGKDVAAKMAYWTVCGDAGARMNALSSVPAEEFLKRWESQLLSGCPYIHSENNKDLMNCTTAIEAALTTRLASVRRLGGSDMDQVPNGITFSLSANVGYSMTADMRGRCVTVRLRGGARSTAEIVVGRKRKDVDGYLRENRSRIYSALWAMIRGWDEAGRPTPADSTFATGHLYGSTIAGVVVAASYANPAATDDDEEAKEVEVEAEEWAECLRVLRVGLPQWKARPEGRGWLPSEIIDFIEQYNERKGMIYPHVTDGGEVDSSQIELPGGWAGELMGHIPRYRGDAHGWRIRLGRLIKRHAGGEAAGGLQLKCEVENLRPPRREFRVVEIGDLAGGAPTGNEDGVESAE